jgi:hypothetical protein
MPEALSFTEIGTQHLELLPERTVMSMFMTGTNGGTTTTGGTGGTEGTAAKDAFSMVKDVPLLGKLLGGS